MFPDTAKLYLAPISDSQCYDERFVLFISHDSVTLSLCNHSCDPVSLTVVDHCLTVISS